MNESSLKYTAYKTLLEGKMSEDQYSVISEINFLKMLGIKGGAMLQAMKAASGTASSVYGDKKIQGVQDAASAQMQKLIKQIRQIANENDMDENAFVAVVAMVLKKAFSDAGITDPKTIFAAFDKAAPEAAASIGGGDEGSVPSGTAVTTDAIEQNPGLASAVVAAATGRSASETETEISKKKPNAAKLLKAAAIGISKDTGVDVDKATKIIKTLMDTGHVVVEGRSMYQVKQLSQKIFESRDVILERWQMLAGLKASLLKEGASAEVVMSSIKRKEIKTVKDFINAVNNLKDDKEAIADIEKNKSRIVGATEGDYSFQGFDKRFDEIMKELKGGEEPEAKPEDEKSKSEKGDSAKPEFDLEDAKKEFANAFKEVRPKLGEEVTDEELVKVMKAIDVKDELEIK